MIFEKKSLLISESKLGLNGCGINVLVLCVEEVLSTIKIKTFNIDHRRVPLVCVGNVSYETGIYTFVGFAHL